jgi:Ca2+:H+ antiporter
VSRPEKNENQAEPVVVEEEEKVGWGRNKALGILAAVAIGLAIMSEVLTGALDPAAATMGLTPRFAGVFLLALVGNAAELFNAVRFASRDKMDLAIGITVGAGT